MPRAVITSVEQNERHEVVIKYDVFRDDGSLWETLWMTLGLDEYSTVEVDKRIRMVLNKLTAHEGARKNPATHGRAKIQTDLVNREVQP